MNYFVYGLVDPRDNTVFYVGKGKGDRPKHHWTKLGTKKCNPRKATRIIEIELCGLETQVHYYAHFETESEAYEFEEALIAKLGRIDLDEGGSLTNICKSNRPPNPKGRVHSEITRAKLRGPNSKKALLGEANGFFGKEHSEANRKKFAENARKQFLGVKKPDSQRERMKKSFDAQRRTKLSNRRSIFNQSEKMRKAVAEKNKKVGEARSRKMLSEDKETYTQIINLFRNHSTVKSISHNFPKIGYNKIWRICNKVDYYEKILKELAE